jgi:nitrate reductase alpha subunit
MGAEMIDHNNGLNFNISRRGFLKISGATVASVAAAMAFERMAFLQSIDSVDNPLAFYPNRCRETTYRDQFRSDSDFFFVCAPNDTHNC